MTMLKWKNRPKPNLLKHKFKLTAKNPPLNKRGIFIYPNNEFIVNFLSVLDRV